MEINIQENDMAFSGCNTMYVSTDSKEIAIVYCPENGSDEYQVFTELENPEMEFDHFTSYIELSKWLEANGYGDIKMSDINKLTA